MEDKKINYQLVLVLKPKLEEKERNSVFKEVESKLNTLKAEVASRDHLGQKEMVYKIQGFSRGDYWVWELESEKPLVVKDFNVFLNRETNIIRYLILKK
jgi:ribosomal protein S6